MSLVLFLQSNLTQAKSIGDATEWRLRDKKTQEIFDKKLQQTTLPIQLPSASPLSKASDETVCFVINTIEIKGKMSNWAKKEGQSYLGQCVGLQSITSYIRLINKKLLSKGYITSRASLPEQNLTSHTLIITIQEGTIEDIVFPDSYRFFWSHSLPLKIGNILNLRDTEQAVDQLNRLQSQNIEFKIKPGIKSNSSILIAEVKETKRWYMNASIDDSGSNTTGKYPLSLSGGFDNALFIQDSLSYSLSAARHSNTGKSNSASITWELPIGYWLFKLNKSYSNYQQENNGSVTNFELTGNTNDNKLSIDYVLSRDNNSKISLFGYLKTRERHNFINGTEIEAQQINLTEIELGNSTRLYLGRSVLDISFSVHHGLPFLGADSVNKNDNSDIAQPDYRFYSLASSINYPFSLFNRTLNYTGQFSAQLTDSPIYSLDWFSIGSRYTVRGFESEQALSSDKGWRIKNDIALPFNISEFSTTSYLGLDVGQVFGEGIEGEEKSKNMLAGLTLGIKGRLLGINYDLSTSKPFLAYGPYATANDYTLSASLSTQF